MPAISKIRLTNVVYEEGNKRYNDELFMFDGHNGAILLENGGGKTVLIQTALQAIIPHTDLAGRQIKHTLQLENAPAHIAIEWIDNDVPRRYVVTAVSLFMTKYGLDSLRYVYEYEANDPNGIEGLPFVRQGSEGKRTAERGEMQDYYSHMRDRSIHAHTFATIKEYRNLLESQYHIIAGEWNSITKINSSEGGVEAFFDECKSTTQLFDRLLIPTVEQSLVGHDANLFANLFESQHASFKHYKKLKETIEENLKIQAQLESYVAVYERLHKRELSYVKGKERTKGAWLEVHQQKEKLLSEQAAVEKKLAEWQENQQHHGVKTATYDILREENEFNRLEKEYKTALAQQLQQEEALTGLQKDYYSLKLAQLKGARKSEQDQLKHFEAELEKLKETEDLARLEERLEETRRALLGYFLTEIEKIKREKQGLTYELNPILTEINSLTEEKTVLAIKEKEVRSLLAKAAALIGQRTKDMERLKQQILANPEHESVQEELTTWSERHQFLDEEIIRLNQEEKLFTMEIKEAETRLEELRNEHAQTEFAAKETSYVLTEISEAQHNLITELAELRPQWASLENIYLTQESIETRLLQMVERLRAEKATLLYRERIAYRYVDDYENQELFFADSFLEQHIHIWKNQFDYLVTGVEYVNMMDDKETRSSGYLLWPLTLVTTAKSKPQLIEKVNHVADRLQFPIIILSTEEAVAIGSGTDVETWITPQHWETNLTQASFADWKQGISKQAQETTSLREGKEREINRWEDVLKDFTRFLSAYPYEKLTNLQEKQTELLNKIEQLTLRLAQEQEYLGDLRQKIALGQAAAQDYRAEMQGVEMKIEKGYQYLQFAKEVAEEKKQETKAEHHLHSIEKEMSRLDHLLKQLNDQKRDLEQRVGQLAVHVHMLENDEEYTAVRHLTPIFSSEDKATIHLKIRHVELEIKQITVTHGEWQARRDAAVNNVNSLTKQITELMQEQPQIDEAVAFPRDGEQLLEQLKAKLRSIADHLETLSREVATKATRKDKQAGKWETKVDQFKEDYPGQEMFTFSAALEEIAAVLRQETEELRKRKSFIDQELTRVATEINNLDGAERWLEKYIESHHFDAPDIVAQSLTPEEKREFTYHTLNFLKGLTNELMHSREALEAQQHVVSKAKAAFRAFCQDSITDIKMRKMAINGIEHKTNYHDIIEFRKNMMISVERATSYANEHIRQKDAELQAFINQVHTHLVTVVEELSQIPKNTKVKIAADWKQIFSFTIPEWEEEIGKTRIRDYIEWMLQQLESDRFLNEQGLEDEGKVRKEIETWLQSKQLLQIVMNNEVMKVSCRKVTNDNKVTTRSYSWEQSNIWSGGEKWSKNMTLFLGILNYVAEKKQHIQAGMKRHRAVILDNPFGKASSEHVLSPVFFVAEQLGFQIIALTAHAEGKFLQDYFPVIYSCRLRAAANSTKKVMTKEKWLHRAYFQDHEPKTIERLGETEQLELF
ncbi:hypothetical protein [Bacillus rubiinfantis]|uniref:hypothetical protein n=1 Tax=Bacillus rubiinfantis TaxID=1499680 RepID=UPI0005AB5C68|nr:hypothetical protein [Bacillus rubiinfantis]